MPFARVTIIPEKGNAIEAMYNPAELSIETRNQFQRTNMPGLPTPVTQFVSGEAQKLSFSLFFDTYEQARDVRERTQQVIELMRIHEDLHAPPVCEFKWGNEPVSGNTKLPFKGVIESISQKFTMFLDNGKPVRATLSLSVTEYKPIERQLKELNLQSADRTKKRVLVEGDTLMTLADREYGDPALWRPIAAANNIDNPRLVAAGTELIVPPLEDENDL